jgi:hypothetical protein
MERWQVQYLENPNYKRTEKQIQYVMNHPPVVKGWSRPKPITDSEGWGIYGGTPWSPGVYRLQHYDTINHQALPVNNKNGNDPEGVLILESGNMAAEPREIFTKHAFLRESIPPLPPRNQASANIS